MSRFRFAASRSRIGGRLAKNGLLWVICLSLITSAPAAIFFTGVSPTNLFWPGGTIPYAFDTNYPTTPVQQSVFVNILREWELAANIHLIPRSNQTNYLRLRYDPSAGGGSFVLGDGTTANPSTLTAAALSRGYAHEMGHALGLMHEHQRPDRDSYITILYSNIVAGGEVNFEILTNNTVLGPYDFESIMHYYRGNFSIDPATRDVFVPNPPYYEKYYYRLSGQTLTVGDMAAAAYLYGAPATPLTNVVTVTTDGGFGSLRAAIYYANSHPGSTVRFNIPTSDAGYSNGVFTIKVSGQLPPLTADGTVIDGSTQPGHLNKPVVVVTGSALIPEAGYVEGLNVYAANCLVRGMTFNAFTDHGVQFLYPFAISNRLEGCFVGLDASGTNAAPNAGRGVNILLGGHFNVIGGTNAAQRNVISGNNDYGMAIVDSNTFGNVIQGNYIGLDWTGSRAVSNLYSGIGIWGQSRSNIIGGAVPGAGNVISGNNDFGIQIVDTNSDANTVLGNYIGTDFTGTNAIPNRLAGLDIGNGSRNTVIGGTTSGSRNVISGNQGYGIYITDPGTLNTVVQGNYVGTDPSGLAAVPNDTGIGIFSAAQNTTVGGLTIGAGNVISGNNGDGLILYGVGTSNNMVFGNYIGTAKTGSLALGNGSAGVSLISGPRFNLIGGTSSTARNVISANGYTGVYLNPASDNVVQGNFIGIDATGTNALGNLAEGLSLFGGSQRNLVGGTAAGAGNVIGANRYRGVVAGDTNTSGNLIQGNLIGVGANGISLGNGDQGIYFLNGASSNTVGLKTDGTGAGNQIAFSFYDGIHVDDTNTVGNTFRGNAIFANGGLGIDLAGPNSYGPTPNDAGDSDIGPNNLQNYPIITNAVASGTLTVISGTLNGRPDRGFLIDVYRNSSADSSGFGEGQIYVGSTSLTTDGSGNGYFTLMATGNLAGLYVTATATDAATGDTSEFAADILSINGPAPPSFIGPFSYSTTGFAAQINLTIGESYHIQATTNLSTNPIPWINLTNFTATGSPFPFSDRGATNFRARYYRVTSP